MVTVRKGAEAACKCPFGALKFKVAEELALAALCQEVKLEDSLRQQGGLER